MSVFFCLFTIMQLHAHYTVISGSTYDGGIVGHEWTSGGWEPIHGHWYRGILTISFYSGFDGGDEVYVNHPNGVHNFFNQEVRIFSSRSHERPDGSTSSTNSINIYYPDNTGPAITLDPPLGQNSSFNWTGSPLTIDVISVTDAGSGVKANTFKLDGALIIGSSFRISTFKKYTIEAEDKLGNKNVVTINLNDCVSPTSPIVTADPTTWTRNQVAVRASGSVDKESGLSGYEYRINGSGNWNAGQSVSVSSNCVVQFRARDKEGNTSSITSYTVGNIDKVPPTVPSVSLALNGGVGANGEPELKSLTASWSGSIDTISGIASYSVGLAAGTGADPVQAGSFDPSISSTPLAFQDRQWDFPYRVTVTAHDQVDNTATGEASLPLPPKLVVDSISAAETPEANGDTLVSLTLSCTPLQLLSFDSIRLVRVSGDSEKPLSESITTTALEFTPVSLVSSDGSLLDTGSWTTDVQGRVVFTDRMSSDSGAGHRKIRYKIYTRIHGVPEYGNTTVPVLLANHPGNVTFEVQDLQGHRYGSPEFQLDPGLLVNLVFQGSDPDLETWYYDLERVVIKRQPPDYTTMLKAYRKLTGDEALEYRWDGGYPKVVKTIRLTLGANNIQSFWREGREGTDYATDSFASDITTLRVDNNGLTVTSGDRDAEYDDNGLVAHPGEPLSFELTVPGGVDLSETAWDFGDSSTASGPSVLAKKYHQAPDQTEAALGRMITVTLPGGTQMQLGVTVLDTQEGRLYESEVWKGDHKVLGVVEVPSGMSLTIAGTDGVTMQGSLGAGYAQGFNIKGSLMVGDGVTFKKLGSQTSGWGTILVSGTASFGHSTIQDADRGITAVSTGMVVIQGTKLLGNVTALHVVGSPNVQVDGAEIRGNSLYGIKEEQGGRPKVTNSTILGNFRNYYSFDRSLLGIAEINALENNQGNTGE
jgi:hypothetical protein